VAHRKAGRLDGACATHQILRPPARGIDPALDVREIRNDHLLAPEFQVGLAIGAAQQVYRKL
jgi:hypothetical protein